MDKIINCLRYVNNEILRSKVKQSTCEICKFYKPKSGICIYNQDVECKVELMESCPRI